MPITIRSRFTPLTYDEIARPLIEQTRAQEELENAYVEASTQANQLMAQANQQTDPIAYSRLKQYSEDLQSQVESLLRHGLSSSSRQSLLNMRKRYGQDIVPVQAAITRRNELAEERRKLQLTHPDMLWERDVIGVDDLIRNPQLDYGKTVSGSDISKRAALLTTAIGKGRQQLSLGQNLDKYTQQILNQSGLTAEEIQAALAGDNSVLDKALSNLYASTGVDSWGNQSAKEAVMGYIQEGAMQGVGQYSISTQRDAAIARQQQLADRQEERNWWLKQNGLKMDENGHIVADKDSYMYDHKGNKRAITTSGQIINIESVSPNTSRYGVIGKTDDGLYYRRVGSQWELIEDAEDAAKWFKEGNPEKDGLTPTQKTQRAQFDDAYGGMITFNGSFVGMDKSVEDNDSDIKTALNESDTDYYTAQNVPSKELFKEALKDFGYSLDDYYFIYNRKGRNHWNVVLKKVAEAKYPELVKKYNKESAIEKSDNTPVEPERSSNDTIKVSVRPEVITVGL